MFTRGWHLYWVALRYETQAWDGGERASRQAVRGGRRPVMGGGSHTIVSQACYEIKRGDGFEALRLTACFRWRSGMGTDMDPAA